jgi:hypothetical protein
MSSSETPILRQATRDDGFSPLAPRLGRTPEAFFADIDDGKLLWQAMPGGLGVYLDQERCIAQFWKPRDFKCEMIYVRSRPETAGSVAAGEDFEALLAAASTGSQLPYLRTLAEPRIEHGGDTDLARPTALFDAAGFGEIMLLCGAEHPTFDTRAHHVGPPNIKGSVGKILFALASFPLLPTVQRFAAPSSGLSGERGARPKRRMIDEDAGLLVSVESRKKPTIQSTTDAPTTASKNGGNASNVDARKRDCLSTGTAKPRRGDWALTIKRTRFLWMAATTG